jgi:hypothetical protein
MNIVYSSTTLLNVRPLTVVNGNTCYEIEIRDKECPFKHAFVFTPQSTEFIAVKHAGNIHIFNVKNDGDFPFFFRSYIDAIREHLIKILNLSDIPQNKAIREFNTNKPHNLAIIKPNSPPCDQFLDLTVAKGIIHALNIELQPTCPGFYLHIDYLTSFPMGSTVSMYSELWLNYFMRPPLLLCLMHGDDCVSSITMKVREREIIDINIDSKTNERYEGRKFNTLLRAVAIMISKGLSKSAEQLTSDAINRISARLMITLFNATRLDKTAYEYKTLDELNKIIEADFSVHGGMETCVELNEENIARATSVFHETIARMNCTPLSGGFKRTRKTRKPRKPRKQRKQRKTRQTNKSNKSRKPVG